jgi:hypothetical protein
MTPQELSRKIAKLPSRQLITERFESEIARRKSRALDNWMGEQKKHWLGWLKGYEGPGHYTRQKWEGVPADAVYNRVVNPALVIWLGEAVGVPQRAVEAAAAAALAADDNMSSQSAAIRRLIPWSMIAENL